ncbi:pyridoxal phosphate-dependent decarboxylase family protein [Bailinhaonella thermotolerans]|uniref:Aspartate aminotransferase family protein n=1 Tax=Bailinhaonella thermotolerans TaxID=1070861 RepID=A0A3A4APN8_9ACTN|nr:aminotransferase class V-fold PLP-dependent enzyme [Bailinhaonella thermotolerans]RJL31636.1 aspartate aminotransferase family protein [Bailinhaonella thermotolerans]
MDLRHWVERGIAAVEAWQAGFGRYEAHPSLEADLEKAFGEFTERLTDNYPFFHPRYAGQMLKPPHPAAVVGYLTAMLINPNNHALDGGPATARMEKEVVARLAEMFGFGTHLGHLTSSGTIANLEALFVARESHPGRGVAYSADAHYTHSRMCHVLGVRGHAVPTDARGRMDLDALESLLRTGEVGTVVLTAGTTGLGAVDPIDEALALRERYGVRLHVDAAYGGFFTLLAGDLVEEGPWRAIAGCDSVVIDPHKHGLQPYGCGAVLFRDPAVGRFYAHDSPYTYFTSDDLHLGEISLECSRAGAAAAALWLTFQVLPPTREGLGEVLAAGRRAALRWADLLEESPELAPYQRPELDIVTYYPRRDRLSAIDAASAHVLDAGMRDAEVFVSTMRVTAEAFAARGHRAAADADGVRVLRSVLMKPESETYVTDLHRRVTALAR